MDIRDLSLKKLGDILVRWGLFDKKNRSMLVFISDGENVFNFGIGSDEELVRNISTALENENGKEITNLFYNILADKYNEKEVNAILFARKGPVS